MTEAHDWMKLEPTKIDEVVVPKREGIRAWYMRTTGRARRAIMWATAVSIVVMAAMWLLSEISTLQKIQTFNGALTVPLLGGVWIFAFIFMFLVPSREASFRGQESLEKGVDIVQTSIKNSVTPAVELWARIGQQIQAELPGMIQKAHLILDQAQSTLQDLRAAAQKIDHAVEKNEKFVTEAAPAVQALRRIETAIEREIEVGLFRKVTDAAEAVTKMAKGEPSEVSMPDLSWALHSVKESKDSMEARGRKA